MKIAVIKKQDDQMAVRISIGGFKEAGNNQKNGGEIII